MEIISKIIEPDYTREPYFKTSVSEADYIFSCEDCGRQIRIPSNNQITNHWIGKTDLISDRDYRFLKAYYKIGENNKSYDGGFPVFDKLICNKCDSKYISYCGVKEYSNSAYFVTLNGLIKVESANLSIAIRNSVIEILDLLSNYEQQIDYAKEVGDIVAIQEMICMWFDDTYHPNSTNFIKAFSKTELIRLKEFNEFYDSIFRKLPDKNIKTLHIDLNWEKLVKFANELKIEIKNATQHVV